MVYMATAKTRVVSSLIAMASVRPSRLVQIPLMERKISSTGIWQIKANKLPPRPKVKEEDIEEVFIKGGGNGGQKLNKTNSKVQLKHIPTGIVVSSQHTRSREQNRKMAREILALKIQELEDPENCRTKVLQDYKIQVKRSKVKKAKKKYESLEKAKMEAKSDQEPAAESVIFQIG